MTLFPTAGARMICGGEVEHSLEPRSRGLPAGLVDRAFYARGQDAQEFEARFNGLTSGDFAGDVTAVEGSTLEVR